MSNNRTTNLPHRTLLAGLMLLAVACVLGGIPPEVRAAEEIFGAAQTVTESATEARSRVVPVPEPSAKTLRYYRSGNVLWVVTTLWGVFVPALILFTGFSARLRDWASAIGRKWFFVIGVYAILYLAVLYAINFPLSYYSGFVHQHAYGLSNQTFAHWFGDSLKALVVAMVMGALFLWIPYLLLRKAPQRWWLYTSLVSVPLLALVMLVQPVVIAPLFDDFGPMQDKALEAGILGARRSRRHRRRARVRGEQERGHQNAERLCRRLAGDQTHCPVGHAVTKARPGTGPRGYGT